ncbi:OmpH family outer membrane protein [Cribrihabitans neustonicus]|uniref:OmpH family outer membrane protein n=1 Tax=Cribrihabitans neustonicus TaxID=1429085 RepID=UPI003B5BD4FE
MRGGGLKLAAALACLAAAPVLAQTPGSEPGAAAPGTSPRGSFLQGYNGGAGFRLGTPQSGILTIQPERLFSESAYGKRVAREIEAEGAVLTAENRRIEAELRAEELELAERRAEMEPEAFRALADAFDEKVQETRRAQDQKLREISQMGESARREFMTASLPVLQEIMRETGAGAILEHSSVFLSADSADITSLAIARIDAVLGDGSTSRSRAP